MYNYVYLCNTKDNADKEQRFVYFYDLSNDSCFRTNDQAVVNQAMRQIGKQILPSIVSSTNKKIWICSIPCFYQ